MADRVKTVAVSEIQRISSLTFNAIKSGAYLYPFQGIIYLLSHRALWQPLQSRLMPTLTLGIGVTTAMFLLTFIPQMTLLAFTSGPFVAPVSAALLVIKESSVITNFLSSQNFVFSTKQNKPSSVTLDTFDGTLILKGHEGLVAEGREIKSGARSGDNVLTRLGRLVGMSQRNNGFHPGSSAGGGALNGMIRSLLYLPLNFIPVIGTALFLVLEGKKSGQRALDRYFELKGFTTKDRDEWLEKHEGEYISFGVASSVLQMVPFASFLFACTNTVGAALWAANIEAKSGTAPGLREQSKKAT